MNGFNRDNGDTQLKQLEKYYKETLNQFRKAKRKLDFTSIGGCSYNERACACSSFNFFNRELVNAIREYNSYRLSLGMEIEVPRGMSRDRIVSIISDPSIRFMSYCG